MSAFVRFINIEKVSAWKSDFVKRPIYKLNNLYMSDNLIYSAI